MKQQLEQEEENKLKIGIFNMNNKMSDDELIRIFIHKSLLEEFRVRKEDYEKKLGYKINGGTPVISQLCAKILEKERTGNKDRILLEIHKVKGLKRYDVIFL